MTSIDQARHLNTVSAARQDVGVASPKGSISDKAVGAVKTAFTNFFSRKASRESFDKKLYNTKALDQLLKADKDLKVMQEELTRLKKQDPKADKDLLAKKDELAKLKSQRLENNKDWKAMQDDLVKFEKRVVRDDLLKLDRAEIAQLQKEVQELDKAKPLFGITKNYPAAIERYSLRRGNLLTAIAQIEGRVEERQVLLNKIRSSEIQRRVDRLKSFVADLEKQKLENVEKKSNEIKTLEDALIEQRSVEIERLETAIQKRITSHEEKAWSIEGLADREAVPVSTAPVFAPVNTAPTFAPVSTVAAKKISEEERVKRFLPEMEEDCKKPFTFVSKVRVQKTSDGERVEPSETKQALEDRQTLLFSRPGDTEFELAKLRLELSEEKKQRIELENKVEKLAAESFILASHRETQKGLQDMLSQIDEKKSAVAGLPVFKSMSLKSRVNYQPDVNNPFRAVVPVMSLVPMRNPVKWEPWKKAESKTAYVFRQAINATPFLTLGLIAYMATQNEEFNSKVENLLIKMNTSKAEFSPKELGLALAKLGINMRDGLEAVASRLPLEKVGEQRAVEQLPGVLSALRLPFSVAGLFNKTLKPSYLEYLE